MSDTRIEPGRTPSSSGARPSTTGEGQTSLESTQAQGAGIRLQTEHGKTVISDTVVAKVSGLAARDVSGVHDLVPVGMGATIGGFARSISGGDQRSQGVRVEVGQREAAVDLNMTVDYGVNIPQVAEAVRQNIIERVQATTGLVVKEVNVNVVDLFIPGEQAAQQPRVE
jgi:uncharacterized alkaline shock family protein YloU